MKIFMCAAMIGTCIQCTPAPAHVAVLMASNDVALVMGPTGIPTPTATYVHTADELYLAPAGFTGQAISLTTPELPHATSVTLGADDYALLTAVNGYLAQGDHVTVFGYSQSAAAASDVMYALHQEGVPSSDVNFVLVGDSDSPYGILARFVDSLPVSLRSIAQSVLSVLDLNGVVDGSSTPGFYPTDVYTIPGDGFSDWPANLETSPIADIQAVAGLFSTHLEYMGLPANVIDAATLSSVNGLTDYYTIDPFDVSLITTLVDAAVNVGWL